MLFHVETIMQYKVLKFLKEEFDLNEVRLELLNKFAILMHDKNGDSAIFRFNDETGEIDIEFDEDYIKF